MRFAYDADTQALYITLKDSEPLLQQRVEDRCVVDIDGDGAVCGVAIQDPHLTQWPVLELVTRYPLPLDAAYFLTVLSERYSLFKL